MSSVSSEDEHELFEYSQMPHIWFIQLMEGLNELM